MSADSHSLKQQLQSFLGDGLAIIVGSGLSVAEGIPGMDGLAVHLTNSVPAHLTGTTDLSAWKSIEANINAGQSLERALMTHPPPETVQSTIDHETAAFITHHERQVVTGVVSGQITLRFTRLLSHLLRPQSGIPVITTNYDRLIEIAVEEAHLGCDTMFFGQVFGILNEVESRNSFCRDFRVSNKHGRKVYRDRIRLFKPHGSIDWYLRDGVPVRYQADLPLRRLIITPGLHKFRSGYDRPFDRHRDRANSEIERADRFLIIGYGFNDDHLENYLRHAIARGKPALVLARTLTPNALQVMRQHLHVIGLENASAECGMATVVHTDGVSYTLDGTSLWDLGAFVGEVLEP